MKADKKRRTAKSFSVVDVVLECDLSVPEKEAETCFYYEYARECQPIVDHLANRDSPQRLGVFKSAIASVLRNSSFPAPWRSLPEEQRISLVDRLPQVTNAMDYKRATNIVEDGLDQLTDARSWFTNVVSPLGASVVRTAAIAVNLAAGSAAIAREVEQWAARHLRSIREAEKFALEHPLKIGPEVSLGPEGDIETIDDVVPISEMTVLRGIKYRTPGPNSWSANLHRLGALRWRHYCIGRGVTSFREATQQQGNDLAKARPIYYSRPSDFSAACNEAVQIFREMFPADTPIHFTRSWGKR